MTEETKPHILFPPLSSPPLSGMTPDAKTPTQHWISTTAHVYNVL